MIVINSRLSLPENEIRFTFSRSGGPGGQNVNKVSTRVTLWFDVNASASLTDIQKQKISSRLKNRMNESGMLTISSTNFRTQRANREDVVLRFQALIAEALIERPARKKTRPPRRVKEKRLQAKKRKSRIKLIRSTKDFDS